MKPPETCPRSRPEPGAGERGAGEPIQILQFGTRLFIGCDPGSCTLSCDKAHDGTDFDGVIARWAVPHFGQKPAGSALNAVALCLLRHMAASNPARGELRGGSVRTGNGVVWVDDFCLWTVVPWHPPCEGLAGGCETCLRMLPHSERLDAEWQELCADLGVPLSAEKQKASSGVRQFRLRHRGGCGADPAGEAGEAPWLSRPMALSR